MNDPKGSFWRKWDLHIHTPASFHWQGQRFVGMTPEQESAALKAMADKMAAGDVAAFGIMEALRVELAGTNIGTTCFVPGQTTTNIGESESHRPEDLKNAPAATAAPARALTR